MSEHDAVLYSGATKPGSAHNLGSPHYSYRFAEEKFLRCFSSMSMQAVHLAMPEYYSAPRSYNDLPRFRGRLVHFMFRSTEDFRFLKDGYNIACFAWEFPHLKDFAREGEHPFSNQVRMLRLCEEIWVPCRYTVEVLERHGIGNVHWLPAPVEVLERPRADRKTALSKLGHLNTKPFQVNFLGSHGIRKGDTYKPLFSTLVERGSSSRKTVYLSVFNPEDFRKNLDALVRGFDLFQQRHGQAVLLIKALTSAERFSLDQVVSNVMLAKLASGSSFANDSIVVFNEYLEDDEMTALYDLADFYLCTSIAEGQNLPLLEAMARGVVPVTTRNTAMLDYVDTENSVVIETDTVLNECEHLAGNVSGKPYNIELCSAKQVEAALSASARLGEEARAAMGRRAREAVGRVYSHESIEVAIRKRLQAIAQT